MPLDFRTAMVGKNGKLIIQAKPLKLNSMKDLIDDADRKNQLSDQEDAIDPDKAKTMDEYLRSVRKEAFDFDDENLVLIDPGMDFKSIFKGIDLPCNLDTRINNTETAPTRQQQNSSKALSRKHYESDSDGNSAQSGSESDSNQTIPASPNTLRRVNE